MHWSFDISAMNLQSESIAVSGIEYLEAAASCRGVWLASVLAPPGGGRLVSGSWPRLLLGPRKAPPPVEPAFLNRRETLTLE